MKRSLATIFFSCLSISSFSQQKEEATIDCLASYHQAEKLFGKAELLSDKADFDEKTQKLQNQLYAAALSEFHKTLKKAFDEANDSLSFHIFIKMGLINHYFDSLAPAKENYLKAIKLKTGLPNIPDSFLFKPYLFLGGILYDEHQFDSASLYYQKAEEIQNHYKNALEESQRLYNKLGAMYYEMGNYQMARTHFEKALSALSPLQPFYTSLMINYKINIASILVKLEQYKEAKKMYEAILPYKIYENEIWHNLGIINNHLGEFSEAVRDFEKVRYHAGNKTVDLNYNLAVVYNNLNQTDSTSAYLQKAILEGQKISKDEKNTTYGLVLKFSGDKEIDKGEFIDALNFYQQAIIQFDLSFNEKNIYENPGQFSGIFSYINLFNVLSAKAGAFEKLFRANKETKFLEAALDAFRSAFKLVDYVEKVYESDESRLFLNQIKYLVHGKPIDLCLELYRSTKEKKYLEEAYFFDQQNKASILSLNLQLREIQKQGGASSELIGKESSLRSSITRLSLKAAQLSDRVQMDQINKQVSNLEIQLADLQQNLNNDPKYSQLQLTDLIPSISLLQNKTLDQKTALVSYHLSEKELLILIITTKGLNFFQRSINGYFYKNIQSYLEYLHNVDEGENFGGNAVSKYLYTQLITPLLPFTHHCSRLVIIPDDELNYLPFEALKDENDHYLLESFSVQYQYSTALLNINAANKNIPQHRILAFAPFTGGSTNNFGVLKYSKTEVENLDGRIFLGKDATKQNFLNAVNHYEVIHLATHASVNDQYPLQSFISFYPADHDSSDRLYAQEIYNLRLDSTRLVILSACETGSGQLVRGEGLMSLSRAFAYAGCPNIITSLWKAEDKTTAFITKRLHFYLQKNYPKDEALRKAKLDLLNSREIEPRFKTPNYWAHLVFIGNYTQRKSVYSLWWVAGSVILAAFFIFLLVKTKSRHKAGPSYS